MNVLGELYKKNFDGAAYAKYFIGEVDYEFKWAGDDFYHDLFTTGKLKGKTLLDIGCGPSVRGAISASAYVPEIFLSDYLEGNLKLVKKWLKNEPDAIDYSAQFNHAAQLEGNVDAETIKARVRSAVKGTLQYDILAGKTLESLPYQQFDIVTSFGCIDCIPDDKDYVKSLINISNLIRPGGHLVLGGTLGCTKYNVGGPEFPVICLDIDKVKKSVEEAKLKILQLNEHVYEKKTDTPCDWKGIFTLFAEKP